MGSKTLSEMRTEIRRNLDNRNDVTDAVIDDYINHTYLHLCHPSTHRHEEMAATYDLDLVAGTSSYSIAEAVLGNVMVAIRSASYYQAASGSIDLTSTQPRLLKPKSVEWYDQRIHPQSQPAHYVVGEDLTILISPTPNAAHTIRLRYWKEPTELSGNDDVTELKRFWDRVLILGSQALTEFSLGYRDRSIETFQLYNSFINNAQNKGQLEGGNWGYETPVTSQPHMGIS